MSVLTCRRHRCVWRCATALEYISPSVCGCINVAELLLAGSGQIWLKGGIRAAESGCTLRDAKRGAAQGSETALYLLTGRPAAEPCSCVRVRRSRSAQSDTLITAGGERAG